MKGVPSHGGGECSRQRFETVVGMSTGATKLVQAIGHLDAVRALQEGVSVKTQVAQLEAAVRLIAEILATKL